MIKLVVFLTILAINPLIYASETKLGITIILPVSVHLLDSFGKPGKPGVRHVLS
jgi:hypothetical protein